MYTRSAKKLTGTTSPVSSSSSSVQGTSKRKAESLNESSNDVRHIKGKEFIFLKKQLLTFIHKYQNDFLRILVDDLKQDSKQARKMLESEMLSPANADKDCTTYVLTSLINSFPKLESQTSHKEFETIFKDPSCFNQKSLIKDYNKLLPEKRGTTLRLYFALKIQMMFMFKYSTLDKAILEDCATKINASKPRTKESKPSKKKEPLNLSSQPALNTEKSNVLDQSSSSSQSSSLLVHESQEKSSSALVDCSAIKAKKPKNKLTDHKTNSANQKPRKSHSSQSLIQENQSYLFLASPKGSHSSNQPFHFAMPWMMTDDDDSALIADDKASSGLRLGSVCSLEDDSASSIATLTLGSSN